MVVGAGKLTGTDLIQASICQGIIGVGDLLGGRDRCDINRFRPKVVGGERVWSLKIGGRDGWVEGL